MMTTLELSDALRRKIPLEMACDWDNDGIMCLPDPDRPVHAVLLVLDITDDAVDAAIAHRCDVIISHHPLIFRGIRHLIPTDPVARRCMRLCQHNIAALSYHTALDAMDGVNDRLAASLGLEQITSFGSETPPIGRVGTLPSRQTAEQFAATVAQVLGCDAVTVGNPSVLAHRVAVIGGSGADDIPSAIAAGADTMVTGEAGYHDILDAAAVSFNVITAGHYHTEQFTLTVLEELLQDMDPTLSIYRCETNRMKTMIFPRANGKQESVPTN